MYTAELAALRSDLPLTILKEIRPVGAPVATAGRGRIVFSSSENLIRPAEAKVASHEHSHVSALVSGLNGIAVAVFATLFPSDCRLCGAPLINISRLPVCQDCLAAIRPIEGGICSVCGERLVSPYAYLSSADALCGLCRRTEPPFVKATAYGSYESGLRELIHLLKYERVRTAASVLGRMLAEAIGDLRPDLKDSALVVPVPLHSRKLRQRGFNQSELIARAALKLAGSLELGSGILESTRETQSQVGLSRHQRRENMRGAFAVARPDTVAGRDIVLVDDVFTTGTTVSECARMLRRTGASKVYVATVARTLKAEAQNVVSRFDVEQVRAASAAS